MDTHCNNTVSNQCKEIVAHCTKTNTEYDYEMHCKEPSKHEGCFEQWKTNNGVWECSYLSGKLKYLVFTNQI